MKDFLKSTKFISGNISVSDKISHRYFANFEALLLGYTNTCVVGFLPGHLSLDKKKRPLLFDIQIKNKIENKHGPIPIENLLINAQYWDFIILNFDKNPDKINLIKQIPNSPNFLLIAAVRNNGFFVLTHFETEILSGNELKSLLHRGDFFSRDVRPGSLTLPPKAS